MKVDKQLIRMSKTWKGIVLGFGINDDKLLDTISENDQIQECNLLNLKGRSDDTSEEGKKLKNISVYHLRRKFKKKRVDVILADIEEITSFQTSFIKDSIYLTKGQIYLFLKTKEDIKLLIKRYKRYHTKIEEIKCSDGILLKLDVSEVKSSKWRDLKNSIFDKVSLGIDIITEIIST